MYLAQMQSLSATRAQLRAFGGLNETYGCSEAEYESGQNFSSRDWPALSTRLPRRKLWEMDRLNGLHHLDGLLTVRGDTLEYRPDDPDQTTVLLAGELADGPKQMVSMGTKVLIWPDKKIFDTSKGRLEPMGAAWTQGESITFTPCDLDGVTYTPDGAGSSLPSSPKDGYLYLLTNSTDNKYAASSVLQKYSTAMKAWSTIDLSYCKIEAEGIGTNFVQWDTVHFTGISKTILEGLAADLEGDKVLTIREDDCIVVQMTRAENSLQFYGTYTQTETGASWKSSHGSVTSSSEEGGTAKLERQVPDLEYVTECDNRVWGCNSTENVIYACKLGDPTNWYSYRGIASDSYAVTVGSDGPFTGAASCMGYVLFFKENTMHKIFGTKPADYQTTTLQCRGVAKGAAGSLCVINETLYYLSAEGVMSWDGSLPGKISATLGRDSMANAVGAAGGALDGRYYLYITQAAGALARNAQTGRLLVYDTEQRVWHEEDGAGQAMASTGRQLYLWDGAAVWAADPSREMDWPAEEGMEQALVFDWISGEIGLDTPEDKYISRITLRLDLEERTELRVLASYDRGPWQELGRRRTDGEGKRIDLAFVPRRHDLVRLRLTGTGQLTLRTLALSYGSARGRQIEGAVV